MRKTNAHTTSYCVRELCYVRESVRHIAELHLDFGDVSFGLYSVEEGRLDSTWFDPLRLVHVGILSVNLLQHLPRQVVHGLVRGINRL